ncbi:MAG: hypothetical protein M0C28_27740 [Candidatus Moduliflexus flocculans]|nr:hypothetical protein [Candidatus Moduliflexus flocculans]
MRRSGRRPHDDRPGGGLRPRTAVGLVRLTVVGSGVREGVARDCAEVLDVPSPKLQNQAVGPPVEVSVNCTDWPTDGAAGAKEKDAVSPAATTTVRLEVLEPELLVVVSVTL